MPSVASGRCPLFHERYGDFARIRGTGQSALNLLDKETHRFKAAADFNKLFEQAGISLDKPTATHCQSGAERQLWPSGWN